MAADRLVLWNYFALARRTPAESYAVAGAMRARAGERFVMSVGLWGPDDQPISPTDLGQALNLSAAGGASSVAVTPTSLMTADHWAAVRRAWTA